MTINQGLIEAFRRLGATEEEIERNERLAKCAFPAEAKTFDDMPIPEGQEEEWIQAYIKLTNVIAHGPVRERVLDYLNSRHASN